MAEQKKKRVFLDMDGTLVAFKKIEVKDYEGLLDAKDYLNSKGYFLNADPHENVIEAVKLLAKEHADDVELFICSAVYDDALYAKDDKNAFLDMYLPEIDSEHRIFTVCGQDKKEFIPDGIRHDDYLIDDLTRNLKNWQPPAMGIKLLNGINHTNQTWQNDMISFAKNPRQIADDIYNIVVLGEQVKDKPPVTYEEYQIMHSITANPFKNDAESLAFENQTRAVRELWDKIIRDPSFVSVEVPFDNVTYILTKSTRPDVDFQLSSLDRDGNPIGHMDLMMDNCCGKKDALFHLGAVEYMSKFYGTEDHILTLKILKHEKTVGREMDDSLLNKAKTDEALPTHEKENLSVEYGKDLLLRELNVKLKAMEQHLLTLKEEHRGEEFKSFYDFVYSPQKHKVEKIIGFQITLDALSEYRDKTESSFYCLAEKVVKTLNVDNANQLNEVEMTRLIEKRTEELAFGSRELVKSLYDSAVQGSCDSLMVMYSYMEELNKSQMDFSVSDVFGTHSFQEFIVKQAPSFDSLELLIDGLQNRGAVLNINLERADKLLSMENNSLSYLMDKKAFLDELSVCSACSKQLLEVKTTIKDNMDLEISTVLTQEIGSNKVRVQKSTFQSKNLSDTKEKDSHKNRGGNKAPRFGDDR